MSLYPCHECGRRIAEDARVCPRCGAVDPVGAIRAAQVDRRQKIRTTIKVLLGTFVAYYLLGILF